MTASRQFPSVRTRRVLVNQPFPYEAVLGVRSQEAQFTFMARQQAANETRQRAEHDEEQSRSSKGNVPMLVIVLGILVAIGAGGAALAVWLAPYVSAALDFADRNPIATGFAVSGLLIAVLLAVTGTRFLDTKEIE